MTIRFEPTSVPEQSAFIFPITHPFNQRHPDQLKLPASFKLDTKFSSAAISNGRWVWFAVTKQPKALANLIDLATEYFQLRREKETADTKADSLYREVLILTDKIVKGPPPEKVSVLTADVYLEQPVEHVREIEHDGSEESIKAFQSLSYQTDRALDIAGADANAVQLGTKFSMYVTTTKGMERIDVVAPKEKTT